MCLEKVDEKPKVEEGAGYKVGYIRFNFMGREQCFVSGDQQTILPLGRWVKDRRTEPLRLSFKAGTYPTGFHIFLKRSEARQWTPMGQDGIKVVARVKFKDVQVTGTQVGNTTYNIVVARRICILKPKMKLQ